MTNKRDNFTKATIATLAKRVGYCCSNPECNKPTIGPGSDPMKATIIGKAAHISAASPGGPRYNARLSSEQRKSIENGIWLCSDCATFIDREESFVSVDILQEWKRISESAISRKAFSVDLKYEEASKRVSNGEYVKLDINLAFNVIVNTQDLGDDLKQFVLSGAEATRTVRFKELNILDARDYVLHDVSMEMEAYRKDRITLSDLERSFNHARIYAQRYDIKVPQTVGKVFIWRTPTQRDFERAQEVVVSIIDYFRKRLKGESHANSPSL